MSLFILEWFTRRGTNALASSPRKGKKCDDLAALFRASASVLRGVGAGDVERNLFDKSTATPAAATLHPDP
jgi:hypothetical protein